MEPHGHVVGLSPSRCAAALVNDSLEQPPHGLRPLRLGSREIVHLAEIASEVVELFGRSRLHPLAPPARTRARNVFPGSLADGGQSLDGTTHRMLTGRPLAAFQERHKAETVLGGMLRQHGSEDVGPLGKWPRLSSACAPT
jgi:uncharacterized protein YbjT (DUF2867 family)